MTLSLLAGIATGGYSTAAQATGFGAKALMYGGRFLKMQKSAPAVLNMITRGSAAYQRIANDPNLSNAQKYAHSSLMGVVEGAGDSFLAATFDSAEWAPRQQPLRLEKPLAETPSLELPLKLATGELYRLLKNYSNSIRESILVKRLVELALARGRRLVSVAP